MKLVTLIVIALQLIFPIQCGLTYWEHLLDLIYWKSFILVNSYRPCLPGSSPERHLFFTFPRQEYPYMEEQPKNLELLRSFDDKDWKIITLIYMQRNDYYWFSYWFQFRNDDVAISTWEGMKGYPAFYKRLIPTCYIDGVVSLREILIIYRQLTDKEFQRMRMEIRGHLTCREKFEKLLRGFIENGMRIKADILALRVKV